MARTKRVHLAVGESTACPYEGRLTTLNPAAVTCTACRSTPHMADAEIRLSLTPRRDRLGARRKEAR